MRNAIGSNSFSSVTPTELDEAILSAAGDETTWGKEEGANYIEAEGPPKRHDSQEVEYILESPAGGSRSRRRRWGRSPFDHLERRRQKRRREEAPRRSITPSLVRVQQQKSVASGDFLVVVTTTSNRDKTQIRATTTRVAINIPYWRGCRVGDAVRRLHPLEQARLHPSLRCTPGTASNPQQREPLGSTPAKSSEATTSLPPLASMAGQRKLRVATTACRRGTPALIEDLRRSARSSHPPPWGFDRGRINRKPRTVPGRQALKSSWGRKRRHQAETHNGKA